MFYPIPEEKKFSQIKGFYFSQHLLLWYCKYAKSTIPAVNIKGCSFNPIGSNNGNLWQSLNSSTKVQIQMKNCRWAKTLLLLFLPRARFCVHGLLQSCQIELLNCCQNFQSQSFNISFMPPPDIGQTFFYVALNLQ